jgi:hypothetical protein
MPPTDPAPQRAHDTQPRHLAVNTSLAQQLRQLLRIHAITRDPDVLVAALDELCAAFEAPRANTPKCKRCKCEGWMLTDEQRVEDHAKLLALVSGPIAWTCPAEQSLLNHASPPRVLAHAWHLAGRLVAADQGLCVVCTEFIEGPAR